MANRKGDRCVVAGCLANADGILTLSLHFVGKFYDMELPEFEVCDYHQYDIAMEPDSYYYDQEARSLDSRSLIRKRD
jgi:hypothetical protein